MHLPSIYRTIVDPQIVREHLGDSSWVVVDCRYNLNDVGAGHRAYDEANIQGAFYASLDSDLSAKPSGRNGRHPLPEPRTFASFLHRIGVGRKTQVVAYDAG